MEEHSQKPGSSPEVALEYEGRAELCSSIAWVYQLSPTSWLPVNQNVCQLLAIWQ